MIVSLPLLAACSTHARIGTSTAAQLCRRAFGEDEAHWLHQSEPPLHARELLRAAAKGPEGRIQADAWFVHSQGDVAICALRGRERHIARVFVVHSDGGSWELKRVYAPVFEIPQIVEPETKPPPEVTVSNPSVER